MLIPSVSYELQTSWIPMTSKSVTFAFQRSHPSKKDRFLTHNYKNLINVLHIKMQFNGRVSQFYMLMISVCAIKGVFCINLTRYDAGPDFSRDSTCTQYLPCVTESLVAHGKGHCALLAQQNHSDIFIYDEATTECQVCPLSVASNPGSNLTGSQIAYIRGECEVVLI